jgi:hypothetical protein
MFWFIATDVLIGNKAPGRLGLRGGLAERPRGNTIRMERYFEAGESAKAV